MASARHMSALRSRLSGVRIARSRTVGANPRMTSTPEPPSIVARTVRHRVGSHIEPVPTRFGSNGEAGRWDFRHHLTGALRSQWLRNSYPWNTKLSDGSGGNRGARPFDHLPDESIHLVEPGRSIDLTANLWFGIGSTVMLTFLLVFVSTRLAEPRLGAYDPTLAPSGAEHRNEPDAFADISRAADSRGLRWAGLGLLGVIALILLLTLPPGAPLREPVTGAIIGTSPFMDSLVLMISLAFFVAGIAYGYGVGTIKTPTEVINAVTKSWAGLAGLLLLFLLIAQFVAYFNYSKMPEVAAAWLGDTIENSGVGGIWLLLAAIAITAVANIIIPQAIAKWALLAPIFIPLFLRLGIGPATVLAAFRVGDSPGNVITPIMAYFPLIVVFATRYDKRSGIGTVIALMLPYFIALTIVWTLFFVAWYLIGIPFGLGT